MKKQKKIALITGIKGQDAAFLSKFLLEKNYSVIGVDVDKSKQSNWRLNELGVKSSISLKQLDLSNFNKIYKLLEKTRPDEIYNLGAKTFVKKSFDQPLVTSDTNAMGCLRLLESTRLLNLKSKFYQASSSEMFGRDKAMKKKLNEKSAFNPLSPYAVSKIFAHYITTQYRESYKIFACSGILFNHESSFRGEEFVTRKIVKNACLLKKQQINSFNLGNINSYRDWGYAGDYVEAMWKMLQYKKADDYVIATGKTYSVKYLLELVFNLIGIKYKIVNNKNSLNYIDSKGNIIVKTFYKEDTRPSDLTYLIGNPQKAMKILKWKPKTNFKELIKSMIKDELKRI